MTSLSKTHRSSWPSWIRHPLVILTVGIPSISLAQFARAAAPVDIYHSTFNTGMSGFTVQWTGSGKLDTVLDPSVKGPSAAPALRTDVEQVSTGTVGVGIDVNKIRRWQIELWGAMKAETGSVSVALQCWGANGKQVDWIQVGGLPAGDLLKPIRTVIDLPASVTHLNLLVLHEKFRGQSWFADVSIKEFVLSAEMEKPMTPTGPTRWAATDFLHGEDPTLRDTGAKLLVAAGVTHTRAGVNWASIEPEKGHYDFSGLERQLAEIERVGAKADVVFIHGTPEWASGKTWQKDLPPDKVAQPWLANRAFFPPRDWNDWDRFVTALAAHFKGRVPAWEIVNEPDLWSEGFCGSYDDYKQYLQIAYRAAKKADPKCKVLLAAFVFGEWLPRLLADGMQKSFDGVCVHPYHSQPAGCVTSARKVLLTLAISGAAKPIYITEVGYQSGGWKEGPGVKPNEEEKAQAGSEALKGLAATSNFVCWYTACEKGSMYGLLRDDGDRLRPVLMYTEYGRLTGRLLDHGSPVDVRVTLPTSPAAKGQPSVVTLTARNSSSTTQKIRFWPVGFVTNLGMDIEKVHACEWQGTLKPGESHIATITVSPTNKAKGAYPVGIAVITEGGNALAIDDLKVSE